MYHDVLKIVETPASQFHTFGQLQIVIVHSHWSTICIILSTKEIAFLIQTANGQILVEPVR
jgi:hypothetical protein